MGVDLFLVLSAYLITRLLLTEHRREGTFSLSDFFVRRILRIWPLYFFALALGFLVLPLLGVLQEPFGSDAYRSMVTRHLIPFLTFTGTFSTAAFGYAPSRAVNLLWTISLEEQFYVLCPFFLLALLRVDRRRLPWFLVTLLGFTVLMRLYFVISPFAHPWTWTSLPSRLDPFVLGTALAMYRMHTPPDPRRAWAKMLAGVVLLLVVTCFPDITTQGFHTLWQYLAIAVAFCLIVDAAASRASGVGHRLLANGFSVRMGKVSYGLYVYHSIAIGVVQRYLAGHLKGPLVAQWGMVVLAAFVLTAVLALASYKLLERPFLKLKTRFTHVKSRPVAL
jgi:peptidoglycan/LPS O-acetylase OafA/YrhL